MTLKDAAADYLQFLRHEQGATATTCRTYANGLRSFLRWLDENGHPNASTFDLSTPTLRRYQYDLSARNLRPRTLRGRFQPIKALCVFLLKHGAIKANPAAGLTLPKKDPAIRLTVSEEEVRALLDACERVHPLPRAALCRAILSTLVYSGLRRQELLDLRLPDYDAAEGCLIVRHGKGNKERTVYLPDAARHALDEWKAVRPKGTVDYLFTLDKCRRVGQMGLAAIVEEIKSVAGLRAAPNVKPHSLRHFYASHLLMAGGDLESIRELLGHSDLRTTAIYLHSNRQRIKDVSQLAALEPPKPKEQPKDDGKIINLRDRQQRQQIAPERSRRIVQGGR